MKINMKGLKDTCENGIIVTVCDNGATSRIDMLMNSPEDAFSSYYGSGAQRFCSICQTIISIAKIIVFAVFIIMALCEKTVKVEIKDAPKEETIDKE